MTSKALNFSILLFCILLAACSVQKRHYLKGFHVEWNAGKHNRELLAHAHRQKPVAPQFSTVTKPEAEETAPLADAGPVNFQQQKMPGIFRAGDRKLTGVDCDLIIMRNGDEIKAKVTEIGYDFIKYRRCDNPDGPLYTVQKSEVFMIKYPNGTKDIIEAPLTPAEARKSTVDAAPTTHVGAIVSFLLAMLTLLIFLFAQIPVVIFFLLLISIITIAIRSINKIILSGGKLKGKGFAIVAIIIAILLLAAGLILLSTL